MAAAQRDRARSSPRTSCARTTSSPRSSTATSRPRSPPRWPSRPRSRAPRRRRRHDRLRGDRRRADARRAERAGRPAATAYPSHERHPHRRHRPHRDRDRARAAGARRRGHRALARSRPGARRARRRRGARLATRCDGPAPGRGAERARRGRAPRGRERRPALDRRRRGARSASSREIGTRNLVAGLRAAEPRPRVLVSASGVGYYGPHGDEPRRPRTPPPGDDFLAQRVRRVGARGRRAPRELGLRVATLRTGVVLDQDGGALAKMLPFFRLGIGGPVAGGRQYLPWIHVDDIVGLYLAALDDDALGGRRSTRARPSPSTNRDFSRALGPRAAPARLRARPRLRGAPALRRHGRDRHRRPARGADARPRARLRLPPHRPRRGAARRARLDG